MLISNLYVVARIRPLTLKEFEENPKHYLTIRENELILINSKEIGCALVADHRVRTRVFTLDHIFGSVNQYNSENNTQASIYNYVGKPAVDSLKDGYNCSLFAYGMTGTGKTHTIFGSEKDPGLILRVCDALLNHMKSNQNVHTKYELKISFVEIYNEKILDLLNSTNEKSSLRIREHPKDGPYVEGLTKITLNDIKSLYTVVGKSIKNRTTAANHVHEKSSRSHVICTVYYQEKISGTDFPRTLNSKLCLIDLAGSERVHDLSDKWRLNEGQKINLSLSSLSTVIGKLAEKYSTSTNDLELTTHSSQSTLNSTKGSPYSSSHYSSSFHIPYRNSKLTWLLRDSLGGNARTTMIATISPSYKHYNETLNTLRYAQQAKLITNTPKVNEDACTVYIKQLLNEISALKQKLFERKDNCEIQRYLNHPREHRTLRSLLRKSSSESSVRDCRLLSTFNGSSYFKEHTESTFARWPHTNTDILTTSNANCLQWSKLGNSNDEMKYSQHFHDHDQRWNQHNHKQHLQQTGKQHYDDQTLQTVDQSTQTIRLEEYEKICVDYLHKVELIDFAYNQINKLNSNTVTEKYDKCVITDSYSNINQSTYHSNNCLQYETNSNTSTNLHISNRPYFLDGNSNASYENNEKESDDKEETDEILTRARPLSSCDSNVDDKEDVDNNLDDIRNSKQICTESKQPFEKFYTLGASTSTPKQKSPNNKQRIRKMPYRKKLRKLSNFKQTFVKRSKLMEKPNERTNCEANCIRRINYVSMCKNIIKAFVFNHYHQRKKVIQLAKENRNFNLFSKCNEITSSHCSSTDLQTLSGLEIPQNLYECDISSVKHDDDIMSDMKINLSSLTIPHSTCLGCLSSPSSYKTTVSDLHELNENSDQGDVCCPNHEVLQSNQQGNEYQFSDSTDISLNLDDSLEEFGISETTFNSTASLEVNKNSGFSSVQLGETQLILKHMESLSSPSSICTEDLSFENGTLDVEIKRDQFHKQMIVDSTSLLRKEKYEKLCTNSVDNLQAKTGVSQYTDTHKYNVTCDREFSTINVNKKAHLSDKTKRSENNSSNVNLVITVNSNTPYINNNIYSDVKHCSISNKHSQCPINPNAHLSMIQRLTTSSCLNIENIRLILPHMTELLQTDVLRSNQQLFERLNTIHERMRAVVSSTNPKHMLLLSVNDRQSIYDSLVASSLVEKEGFKTPELFVYPNLNLSETLSSLQCVRDSLYELVHEDNVIGDIISKSDILNPQEFDQIKTTLVKISKSIKADEKLSFLQDGQYINDSIREVISSLEKLNTNTSNEQNSQVNSQIIQHLNNAINLNHRLIIIQGLEAIKQSVQSDIQSNRYVFKRQTAIDIASALQFVEKEYENTVTTLMTNNSDCNAQKTPSIDRLKQIHRCIARQLSSNETDFSINESIFCHSSDISLLEKAFENYYDKIDLHIKEVQQKESFDFINTDSTNFHATHGNIVIRFQDVLTPISEQCTPETSAYETDSVSNESIVKNYLLFKNQQSNSICLQMNQTSNSNEENNIVPTNFDKTSIIIPASTRNKPSNVCTYIDDTPSQHDENCKVIDSISKYNAISDHSNLENSFLVDSSVIAPVVSYLKSKLLDSNLNNLNVNHESYSEYTQNDVRQLNSYLVECLNENSEKPIELTSTDVSLLNKLFVEDKSTYSCILKNQLNLCTNTKTTNSVDVVSESISLVNKELSLLITSLENEDFIMNMSFIENLCLAVSKYSLPILPDKYPCLSKIIVRNPNGVNSLLNCTPLFIEKLSDELKQLLKVHLIELQSENMINDNILMKQMFYFPIVRNSSSSSLNNGALESRPITFIHTMISLYISDLLCSLPNEMNRLIFLVSIHKNCQSLIDSCESPSVNCSPVCKKLKSLFNLCTSLHESESYKHSDATVSRSNGNNHTSSSQIINKMFPSIQTVVQTAKNSRMYQNQIKNHLVQTRNKIVNKTYYFANGETDDIACGILIVLTTIFTTGLSSINANEISIILGKFADFYHSLTNSKCVKMPGDVSESIASFISSELHYESHFEREYHFDQMNLVNLHCSIYQAAFDCHFELTRYEKIKYFDSLILLGILLSKRRLNYNLTDLASAEANILISIVLLIRSNFHVNLQTTLTSLTKYIMKSIHDLNASVLVDKSDNISLEFLPHFAPTHDLWLVKQELGVGNEISIVSYKSPTYQPHYHFKTCNKKSSEILTERHLDDNHDLKEAYVSETFVKHSLYFHEATFQEVINHSKDESLSGGLKIHPQNCVFLMSCLSDIFSPTLMPTNTLKSTQQIVQEIHSSNACNSHDLSEKISETFTNYCEYLLTSLLEKYSKIDNYNIIYLGKLQIDEEGDFDQNLVNLKALSSVVGSKVEPTIWFAISHKKEDLLEEVVDKFTSHKQYFLNQRDDPEKFHNSSFKNDFNNQIILFAHLDKLKTVIENTDENEACILNRKNTGNLFCILEIIKNQSDVTETLKIDQDFLSLFKLHVIQGFANSTPVIINLNSKIRLQYIVQTLCDAEFDNIENITSSHLRDFCLPNDIQLDNQFTNDLILGQIAIPAFSKQLNILPEHIHSLRDYCFSFQHRTNVNALSEQIVPFTSFLSNTVNNSDFSSLESLNKDAFCLKLEKYQKFYDRMNAAREITNSTLGCEILINAFELEHLSQLYSLGIQYIPESLKCSLISALTLGEALFPFTLKEEEQMYLERISKQLSEMTNYVIRPSAPISVTEHPIVQKKTNYSVSNQCPRLNTLAPLLFTDNISQTTESFQDSDFHKQLLSSELQTNKNNEEWKVSAIKKISCIYDTSLKCGPSHNKGDFKLKLSQSIKLANLFHEVCSNEQLISNLNSDEIEKINDIYITLLQNSLQTTTINKHELRNINNLVYQKVFQYNRLFTSEAESEVQDSLDTVNENSDYLISAISDQQNDEIGELLMKDDFCSTPIVKEQDIDIKTTLILISTIRSYLKFKPLSTVQIIPLFLLLENINSQLETLEDEQNITPYSTIKLSSSDLKPIATISNSLKSQIVQVTMTLCTDLLNFKILCDITSYETSIWKTELSLAYSALRGFLSSTTISSGSSYGSYLTFTNLPGDSDCDVKELVTLEQRLFDYYFYSLEEQQPFVLTDKEITSCKMLLQKYESKIKSRILHAVNEALCIVDQSNDHEETPFLKDIYYLIIICLPNMLDISTDGFKSLDMIKEGNQYDQSGQYQPIINSLETILFNPIGVSTEPLKAKQIAFIVENLNHSEVELLKHPFIVQFVEHSINTLCDKSSHLVASSTDILIIFHCIQIMENYFNKNVIEPSTSQIISREDAAALCTSLSWLLNSNLGIVNDIDDNGLVKNSFENSADFWTNLMLLQMWYTTIASVQPFYPNHHYITHKVYSEFYLELMKLEKLEISRLIEFWKPRLHLHSQKQRTVSIQKLSISTECDLTAEVTNQELSNAIKLSLISKQLSGPRNAWICVNILQELQNECEYEFITISNPEKEALRYALCSNTIVNPCELIPDNDVIASLVYLNSFLSKTASSTSLELPTLCFIQPTDAAPFASSIRNILKFIHSDIYRPYSFHFLGETESHLWISSSNLKNLWISRNEFHLIDKLKQKALQMIFKNIRRELINLLNELDEENFIKPNLTQLSIEPINRENLSQLLRVSLLLKRFPVKHTINMLIHLQHLHDISCSVLPVQTISYLRYFVTCILTNENNQLHQNYYDPSVDVTSLINSRTINRLDSSLINCFLYEYMFDRSLSHDSLPIIQTSLVYCNTCDELINFWNTLPKHSRQRLKTYLHQLFCIYLRRYTNNLLNLIMNEEESLESSNDVHNLISLLLIFMKHLMSKDSEDHYKHNEILSVTTKFADVNSLSNIYALNERLKRLLVVDLNELDPLDLIQLIIDSRQLYHCLIYSKIFYEDMEYIPHLQYYLCNSLISKLCNYSQLSFEESIHHKSLSISYKESAMKVIENLNKISDNLSLDSNETEICSLKIDSIKSTYEINEIKSQTLSDNLIKFPSCENLLYLMEDVRPEINRLNHLLAINSLQPNEMSAILSSIVILRDASRYLPSDLKDYTRFSIKEEDALMKLQMLIDKKTIVKLDKQLKHTLLLLSQRLGLLAVQANKDLLRTGLEIWLNASLENKFVFTREQVQQIYYALCLAEQINNQDYALQTNFNNTFDLVEQVILQLKSLVSSKVGAEIEGPHSLGPVVTLFIEHAQQLLENVTYSCKVSTSGIPNNSLVMQQTTADNLWKMISCQSPEVVKNTLNNLSQCHSTDSSKSRTNAEKSLKNTNNRPSKILQRHPKFEECCSLSYDKNDDFHLNNQDFYDSSLSLLALYDEEKRRLMSWEEITETRLRKAYERIENLLDVLPKHTHLQNNPDHILMQLKEDVVRLQSHLITMMKQKKLKSDKHKGSNGNSPILNKNEKFNYLFDNSAVTQGNQCSYQDKLSFDCIQLSERVTHRRESQLNDRLSSSACSLKNFPSLSRRSNQSYLVSCKPVTSDHVFTSSSNVDKRILQNSFDRLHELIEIRRAVVAGSREELCKLGIHSSLPETYSKPFTLIRPRGVKPFDLLSDSKYDELLLNNQRNIDRRRNYTTHFCRSEDEYSRSNHIIEDLENKLGHLEEQILPHRFNNALV
ncbi:StAR-related lipid transfer protein [Schistosoma japonicum]|uniref:StAR-related lipid transfer protein n=1 Tax=Schistosoma japonicum TaxID=6182 RepID=A0A4Z2DLJ5_SCHJA|nr:StAR-related lipid transfer protein [Schistosoma japonicum]